MQSHGLEIVWLGVGLVSACNVPLQHFDRADAASGGDADGPPAFVPLHVLPETLRSGAPDLVLTADPTSIDTTALMIGGLPNPYFVRQGDYAILFASAFSVQNPVTVTGSAPLIVVASGQVTILAPIILDAVKRTPGPGAAAGNPGCGGAGQSVFIIDTHLSSGGGGAGYGTSGAPGGMSNASTIPGGDGGNRYGMSPADPLVGGSKGGDGGNAVGHANPPGGAGGGALQISSAISISVSSSGQIEAGGGGGAGGSGGFGGGGGGGAGGEILLEAPSIAVAGRLVANGGGGGGGGSDYSGPCPGGVTVGGLDGQDAIAFTTPASGGFSCVHGSNGGAGAAGAAGTFSEAQSGDGSQTHGGGGGGGGGRIWLRHRVALLPYLTGAVISPPAGLDPTLP